MKIVNIHRLSALIYSTDVAEEVKLSAMDNLEMATKHSEFSSGMDIGMGAHILPLKT